MRYTTLYYNIEKVSNPPPKQDIAGKGGNIKHIQFAMHCTNIIKILYMLDRNYI